MKVTYREFAAALAMVSLLAACGGGSSTNDIGPNDAVQVPPLSEAQLAKAEPQTLTWLRADAKLRGVTYVVVAFDVVDIFGGDAAALALQRVKSREQLATLLQELGAEVWREVGFGDGTNLGFARMYVTSAGLDIALRSASVRMLWTDKGSGRQFDGSGNLQSIDATLIAVGRADVDIALNVDAQDFSFDRTASFRYQASDAQRSQAEAMRTALFAHATPAQILDLSAVQAASLSGGPMLRLRVTREGYCMLLERSEVLSIRPADWQDRRLFQADQSIAEVEAQAALNQGRVRAVLNLRDLPPSGTVLTTESDQRRRASMNAIFDDILSRMQDGVSNRQANLETYGSAFVDLSLADYRHLVQAPDPRLWQVQTKQIVGQVAGAANALASR